MVKHRRKPTSKSRRKYGGNKGDERRSAKRDFARKLRRKSSVKCKHGALEVPVRLASGRMRRCKKYMGGRKGDIRKSAKLDYKRRKSKKKSRKRRSMKKRRKSMKKSRKRRV